MTVGAMPGSSELEAREAIRDLVARYNSLSDRGRFDRALDVFADDGTMIEGDGRRYVGREQILSVFTRAQNVLRSLDGPLYVRHMTATHVIDLDGLDRARGRSYFAVLTQVGLDHWGTYADQYQCDDETWRIVLREVRIDGRSPNSVFRNIYDDHASA